MWALHFMPDNFIQFIIHAILIIGVVGAFLTFFVINKILRSFPILSKYVTLAQLISAIFLVVGVYFKGGYSTELQWRDRVKEVEAQLEEAKKESVKINTIIETKVITKTKAIKEKGETIVQQVDKLIPVEKDCVIPKEAIDVHNEAARMNTLIEELRKADKK